MRIMSPADFNQLQRLPADLRNHLDEARLIAPISAAFDNHRPVAFCSTVAVTESFWDVAVDTLEGYRRRGLAVQTFLHQNDLEGPIRELKECASHRRAGVVDQDIDLVKLY